MIEHIEARFNMNKKFDIVFSNPPYDRNLHLKIINSIVHLLSDDGSAIIIHPNDHMYYLSRYFTWNKDNSCEESWKHLSSYIEISHEQANKAFNLGNGIEVGLLIGIYKKFNGYKHQFFDKNLVNILIKVYNSKKYGFKSIRTQMKPKEKLNDNGIRIFKMHWDSKSWINCIICYEGGAKEGIDFNSENEKK